MNKITSSKFLSFKINENENYSFSTRGQEFLCLNKRLVEAGVGVCMVAAILRDFDNRTRVFHPEDEPMAALFDYLLPIGFGLSAFVKLGGGYKGLSWLLLCSTLFNRRPDFLNESEIEVLFWSSCSISATIGRGITWAMCLNASLFSLSFLINQYGWQSINTLLSRFNDWQNSAVSGILDIKNNIKYQLSIFSRDVFCLNKALINTYFILGCCLTFSYHFENNSFVLLKSGFFRTSSQLVALCTIQTIFKSYSAYIVFMLTSICMSSAQSKLLSLVLLSEMGSGMIYGGTGLIIFALFSYFTKKTGNNQITKILDYLKDKKRENEHNQYIENQRKLIEKRKEDINNKNKIRYEKYKIKETEETLIERSSTNNFYSIPRKRETKKLTDKKVDKKTNILIKKQAFVEIKKEYTVSLTGKNLTTWNQLFEITKSKPDHLTILGKDIKKLIEALGGSIEKSSKRFQVCFQNKKLGFYEITHGGDRPKYLTSDYAQNVKEAIEKAIDSNYISERLVKVRNRS